MRLIVSLAVLAVDVGATAVCGLKRRTGFLVFGVLVSGLALWQVITVLGEEETGWEDLVFVLTMFYVIAPLSLIVAVAAFVLPARPGSWWHRRRQVTTAPTDG